MSDARAIAGDALHPPVGQEIEVEVGAQPLQAGGEGQRHVVPFDVVGVEAGSGQDVAERGGVVAGGVGEALVDRDAGDDRIEQDGADRILETAHGHPLVDESVLRPAQAAQFGDLLLPAIRGSRRDDEHLEVGTMPRSVTHRCGAILGRRIGKLLRCLPRTGVVLVGPGQDRLRYPPGKTGGAFGLPGLDPLAQGRKQPRAGIGEELLIRPEVLERGLDRRTVGAAARPCLGGGMQAAPPVGAGARQREEIVDAVALVRLQRRTLVHSRVSLSWSV